MSEISLSGGEITILKTIGLTGSLMSGSQLAERMEDMESAEFLDALEGLMSMHYILANKVTIRTVEDVKSSTFHINPTFARALRDAVYPSRARKADTGRRRRRS
jgi:hypothetical protein